MHTLTHNIVRGFYQKINTIFSLNQCVNDHKMNIFLQWILLVMSYLLYPSIAVNVKCQSENSAGCIFDQLALFRDI